MKNPNYRLVHVAFLKGQSNCIAELERKLVKLEALKQKADDALLRYATLKSDCYEDGKVAREYLKAAKELDGE